jgi:predicted nucleic acid-binding Zn ribbon protein
MLTCPSCSAENADGAKFCSECGTSLAQPEQRRKERKFATALFANLVGSTALAEREDLARALMRAGRPDEAESYRDLSRHGRSPAARAHAALVEGLLSPEPAEARRLLAEGTATLDELGLRIDAARGMVDLGRAMARVGEDPHDVLQRARDLLIECDARAFLFEVDDAIADLGLQVDGEGGSR